MDYEEHSALPLCFKRKRKNQGMGKEMELVPRRLLAQKKKRRLLKPKENKSTGDSGLKWEALNGWGGIRDGGRQAQAWMACVSKRMIKRNVGVGVGFGVGFGGVGVGVGVGAGVEWMEMCSASSLDS